MRGGATTPTQNGEHHAGGSRLIANESHANRDASYKHRSQKKTAARPFQCAGVFATIAASCAPAPHRARDAHPVKATSDTLSLSVTQTRYSPSRNDFLRLVRVRAADRIAAILTLTATDAHRVVAAVSRATAPSGESTGTNGPLVLMTAHRAKGLEFDQVLILDSAGWQSGRDEERRLVDVAMTRARKTLSSCEAHGGKHPFLGNTDGLTLRSRSALPVREDYT